MIFIYLVKGCDFGIISMVYNSSFIFFFNNDYFVFSSSYDLNMKVEY